jgi:hypothetical protein
MNYIISKETKDPNYKCGSPFHGDKIFIDIMLDTLKNAEYFVETGTAYGDTLKFIVDNFKNMKAISCEPDNYRHGVVTEYIPDAEIVKITSPQIFEYVKEKYPDSLDKKTIFWLDAHGDYNGTVFWPLREEVEFIKNNYKDYYILIDDFKNPYNDNFKYDMVGNIPCGIEYISDLVSDLNVYYPTYNELTTESWHDLIGWVLITKDTFEDSRIILHK